MQRTSHVLLHPSKIAPPSRRPGTPRPHQQGSAPMSLLRASRTRSMGRLRETPSECRYGWEAERRGRVTLACSPSRRPSRSRETWGCCAPSGRGGEPSFLIEMETKNVGARYILLGWDQYLGMCTCIALRALCRMPERRHQGTQGLGPVVCIGWRIDWKRKCFDFVHSACTLNPYEELLDHVQ